MLVLVFLSASASALQLSAHGTMRPSMVATARSSLIAMDATFIADPSFNLAAGSAVLGTLCGGLEDLKDGEDNKLPTA